MDVRLHIGGDPIRLPRPSIRAVSNQAVFTPGGGPQGIGGLSTAQ
jgi:hypothetical protein